METEKKVEPDKMMKALEDEFKLIKGELKETLSSVRDYLLNSELPASEYATILQALGGGMQTTMSGKLTIDKDSLMPEPVQEEIEEIIEEPPPEEPAPESFKPDDPLEPESVLHQEEDMGPFQPFVPESELPREEDTVQPGEPFAPRPAMPEQQMEHRQVDEERIQSTPRVNLLANLTHWVTNSKKEIGIEQLPTFLEIYGITGHLTPELKEIIMHMADITSEQAAEPSAAEIWSKLMLELHGILTGGDAPLHPAKPFWNESIDEIPPDGIDAEMEEEKPKEKPLKLKLVLSTGDDEEKEFCIDLSPAEDKDSR